VVPPGIRSRHPGLPREIRGSLKTDSWRTAVNSARVFRVELDKWLVSYGVKQQTQPAERGILLHYIGLKPPLADGRQADISIERETPEEEARAAAEVAAHWPGVSIPAPAPAPVVPTLQRHTFLDLSEAYVRNKFEAGDIDEKTRGQYRASLGLVAGPIGDKDARDIDWTDAERLLQLLKRYPSNASKRFPGKTATQLLEMADSSLLACLPIIWAMLRFKTLASLAAPMARGSGESGGASESLQTALGGITA
jgi:hypothetical protein